MSNMHTYPKEKPMNHKIQTPLNYNIYGEDRANLVATIPNLSSLSPEALEKLASYILYRQLPQQSANHKDNKTVGLDAALSLTADSETLFRIYTNPHTEIDWSLPCLQSLASARDSLIGQIETATNQTHKARLSKQLRDLYADVQPILEANHPYIRAESPSYTIHDNAPELLYEIEWDNPTHINALISHYAYLDPSDPAIQRFEELCNFAPLSPVQRQTLPYLLAGIPLSQIPTYSCAANVSHGRKRICTHIAQTAATYQHALSTPSAWKPCTHCGKLTPPTLRCNCVQTSKHPLRAYIYTED